MLKFIQSKSAKIGGFVVALALFGAVAVNTASALTMAELDAYIAKGFTAQWIMANVGGSSTTGTTTTGTTYNFGSTTLKLGSTGAAVMDLQKFLGITADGKFGPMTKAKVMAWQSANGLTADGAFGAMSMAKANSMSTTTTTNTTTTGSLSGGAGSAAVTKLSTPTSNTKVGEGDTNTKVLGIEVEADNNSDLSVTSMKVSFVNSGSGSSKLNRYAKSVSIWYNDAKVGSASTDDFSETSGTYSKSISIANAVVKADKVGKFYVAVDAVDDIDSGNTGSSNNTWTVTLSSTRYQDAAGAVLTDSTGSISNTAIFDTLASTNDVEAKVNLASDTPTSKTIKVSTTNSTNQVELLKFTLKAQGSKMVIDQIPVSFTATGTAASDVDQMTSNVTLKINGETFNETLASSGATKIVDFDDLDLEIAEGSTLTGTVYADINKTSAGFAEGDTLTASITSSIVTTTGSGTAALDIEDSNADQVVAGDRSGSAVGNVMTFRATGVNTVMGTPTTTRTTDTNGNVTSVTYTIPVAVTAFGNTLYLGQSAQVSNSSMTSTNAFNVVFENSSAPTTAVYTSFTNSLALSTSNATIESSGFRLDDGTTKNFTLTVNATNPAVYGASYRVRLDQIQTWTNAGLTTGNSISNLLPQTDFRTGYERIDN